MRSILPAAALLLAAPTAFAQASIEQCAQLLDAELIDRSSLAEVQQISENEFQSFCSEEGSLEQAYESTSFGFQGAMRRYGASLGLSFDNSSGSSEQWFQSICEQGSREFSQFMSRQSAESSGAFVTQQYNACIDTLVTAGQSFLTGELRETGDPTRFVVTFRYEAGRDGPRTVTLAGLNGDPVQCFASADASDPISTDSGFEFSGERSITCELPEGQDAAGGTFRFTAPNGPSREVPYSYVSGDLATELEDRIAAQYLDQMRAAAPSGEVAFFDLAACPVGWSLHAGLVEGRIAVGATDGIGGEVGAGEVIIPRDALPMVALRLPTIGAENNQPMAGNPYAPSAGPAGLRAGGAGNYDRVVRLTEYLGLGEALDLPLPPAIALLPCVRD